MTAPKWYDVIAPDNIENENAIYGLFKDEGDQWAIAHEIGEMSGYHHLQCRVKLKKERDLYDLLDMLRDRGITTGIEIQPTHVRNFDYVQKTRQYIRESDEVILNKCRGSPTKWQMDAMEKFSRQTTRKILLVYDGSGNHGKSWLWNRLVGTHQARGIPAFDNGKDIVRCAMAEYAPGFAIDTPRSGTIKKDTWAGIEQIKNGYLYDDRYQWREKHIPIPKIIVFTNKMPKGNELSEDRWEIMDITKEPKCTEF